MDFTFAMTHQSQFLKTCAERGLIHQCTDEAALDGLLKSAEDAKKPVVAYIGFDCTAPSLHVGSLIQIMMLRRWQQAGHKPIVLMGGGTTKVGDPSGKDKSRPPLTDEQIAENMEGIRKVFEQFITFGSGEADAVMVNNDEWLQGLGYLEFLRDYGRHFSVNRMLSMDSVKLRLEREQHLSFLEFNYMILQAFDFHHLAKNESDGGFNCKVQFGGSDQWGNILQGIELHHRLFQEQQMGKEVSQNIKYTFPDNPERLFGLTTPLFTNSAGEKMGKTADGAIWLNGDMFSPYDYWQFWRNVEDEQVGMFLRWFTDLPVERIIELERYEGAKINEAKKMLATEATKMLHGSAAAHAAVLTAEKVFEQGGAGDALPEVSIPGAELEAGISIVELFNRAELVSSNGEARRLIKQGGAKVNDAKIANENEVISSQHLNPQGFIKLSAGKKRHALVKAG